ncbi:putative x-ray repair cross complementing protein [Schistosoma mansoni]|uniref:putative x-ray repair cross complementing protein n=1 Tax=Schistosoma mansoni TaxID=6183 RepID=UPI0001A63BAE|nr:putative x-ray repair cross complementing protein [Schistosoma mansoni]|eukprot:XP_018654972.1 putative x-ray repair cross complementing protein [Schistosoma mansoni]
MQIKLCGDAKINGYTVIFVYHENSISVTAIKNGLWHTVVDSAKLDELCDLVKQTRNQYTQNLSESFSSSDPSSCFTLREEGAVLNFVWSKEIKKGIKIIFGSFYLKPSYNPLESLSELTGLIANNLKESILCCSDFERENEKLKSLADVSVKKYEEVVSQIDDKEIILLSKFSAVLNEKKRKLESYKCSTYALSEDDKTPDKLSLQEDVDDLIPSKDRRKLKLVMGRRK